MSGFSYHKSRFGVADKELTKRGLPLERDQWPVEIGQ